MYRLEALICIGSETIPEHELDATTYQWNLFSCSTPNAALRAGSRRTSFGVVLQ